MQQRQGQPPQEQQERRQLACSEHAWLLCANFLSNESFLTATKYGLYRNKTQDINILEIELVQPSNVELLTWSVCVANTRQQKQAKPRFVVRNCKSR